MSYYDGGTQALDPYLNTSWTPFNIWRKTTADTMIDILITVEREDV